jgi:hypothetical protein
VPSRSEIEKAQKHEKRGQDWLRADPDIRTGRSPTLDEEIQVRLIQVGIAVSLALSTLSATLPAEAQ